MKEYNWRQEREKFRPDFQKENNLVNVVTKAEPVRKAFPVKLLVILGIILLAAVIIGSVFMSKSKDSSKLLAEAAEKHKNAVGLVALTIELQNGKKITAPVGTAWALSENHFATNAHVAYGLKEVLKRQLQNFIQAKLASQAEQDECKSVDEYLQKAGDRAQNLIDNASKQVLASIKDVRADIIINGTRKKSFSVSHVQIHKDYGVVGTKFDPDVAVLTIQGKHDSYFKLANKKNLKAIKAGQPIAFLGFPMELLFDNNVNIDNPVATMQSGIVVAVSDFEMKDNGQDNNFLLRHNLPATGGASGSPIFNQTGEVIALLYAVNIIGQVVDSGKVVRAPSAVQINFGARADLLEGLGNAVAIKNFMKL